MTEAEGIRVQSDGTREADRALVARLREGSPQAQAELCARYGPRLHRFAAARLAGDQELAEELTIQALADGMRSIRRFDERKSTLSAWLYGIVRRQVQGELRKRRRLKSVPHAAQVSFESLEGMRSEEDVGGGSVARLEAQRQVAAVAALLTEIEFEVLVLNCIDELPAREIGQIVGRSERAIHSLLHRARTKARERLADDEEG